MQLDLAYKRIMQKSSTFYISQWADLAPHKENQLIKKPRVQRKSGGS